MFKEIDVQTCITNIFINIFKFYSTFYLVVIPSWWSQGLGPCIHDCFIIMDMGYM
jgi:hypothetical protein